MAAGSVVVRTLKLYPNLCKHICVCVAYALRTITYTYTILLCGRVQNRNKCNATGVFRRRRRNSIQCSYYTNINDDIYKAKYSLYYCICNTCTYDNAAKISEQHNAYLL